MQSQNHRIAEIGRGIWRSSNPGTRYKYSQLKPYLVGAWVSPRTETPQPFWETCARVQSPLERFYSYPLYFSLFPFLVVLSLGTTEKSLALPSLLLPIRCLYTRRQSLWAISSPGWMGPSISVWPYVRWSYSLITFVAQYWTSSRMSTSLFYWEAQTRTEHSRYVSLGLSRGEGSFSSTCCQCFC